MTAPANAHDPATCPPCQREASYRQAKADPVAAAVLDVLQDAWILGDSNEDIGRRALDAARAVRKVFGRSPAAEYREAEQLRFRVEDLARSLEIEVSTILAPTELQDFDNWSFRLGHRAAARSSLARTAADLRRILAEDAP